MTFARQQSLATVRHWLWKLWLPAPEIVQKHLDYRMKIYDLLLDPVANLPEPPAPAHARELVDLDESGHLDGSNGFLFLSFKAELVSLPVDSIVKKIESAKRIEIGIRSTGGSSDAALRIYKALTEARARGVEVVADVHDFAASGAAIILQGAGIRRMNAEGRLMIHGPVSYVAGGIAALEAEKERLVTLREKLIEIFMARAGQPREVVAAWHEKDTWFTPEQALEAALIDQIRVCERGPGA